MARRRNSSSSRKGIFLFALMVIGASLMAGGVASWVTRHNMAARNGAKSATSIGAESGPTPSIDLTKLTRPQLEAEIARLNEALAERNQQIDELKIQLKLTSEGSRAAQ